jgi:hypothetical protein
MKLQSMLLELADKKEPEKPPLEQLITRENFFVREYDKRDDNPGKCILIGIVEMTTGVLTKFPHIRCPNKIIIELINLKTQSKEFVQEYSMTDLGEHVTSEERPIKEIVCRILTRALESNEITGVPAQDFAVEYMEKKYSLEKRKIEDQLQNGQRINGRSISGNPSY